MMYNYIVTFTLFSLLFLLFSWWKENLWPAITFFYLKIIGITACACTDASNTFKRNTFFLHKRSKRDSRCAKQQSRWLKRPKIFVMIQCMKFRSVSNSEVRWCALKRFSKIISSKRVRTKSKENEKMIT